MNRFQAGLLALGISTIAWTTATAQDPREHTPEQPTRQQLQEKVTELLDGATAQTLTAGEAFRIAYKQVPTDVHALAMAFGERLEGRQRPNGMDMDRYVRQFEGRIGAIFEEHLARFGTLTALVELKVGSKKLPAGEYTLGLALEDGRPAALLIQGAGLRRPLPLRLRLRPAQQPIELLTLSLADPASRADWARHKDEPAAEGERVEHDLVIGFGAVEARTTSGIEVTSAEE
jgi:hypothetical protein